MMIGNDKAPKSDDYSFYFFKKSQEVVGKDLCASIQDFFISGKILRQINHSIIALVPKTTNVNSANDFRPILCYNVMYKVIAKFLAGRFGHVLTDITLPMQNAFLGGRSMANNINLIQWQEKGFPRCLLKNYFRKAFDSVSGPS